MPLLVPPPVIAATTALLMWALHRWVPLAQWIAEPRHVLGLLVFAGGVALDLHAVLQFRRARTTIDPVHPARAATLVSSGVFALTRNPMYVGLALQLLGWAVWLGTASCLIGPPLFVALITFGQIAAEERVLAERFGEAYRAYREAVPRWIGPRSFRR